MKHKQILVAACTILLLVVLVGGSISFMNTNRVAYVDVVELYNNFQLKKQLEQDFKKKQEADVEAADSLVAKINHLADVIDSLDAPDPSLIQTYVTLKEHYLSVQKDTELMNKELAASYDAQVWKQLNQFIKDYGDKHGYDFIYGANGQGSLMYASPQNNITSSILEYVNARFEGYEK